MNRARAIRGLWIGILVTCTAAAVRAAAPGDLSGTWLLNRDASDDPKKKMEEARGDDSGSGGGGYGGGSGMGHHGGHRGGGGHSRDGGSSGPFETPADSASLLIEHYDPKLVITDGAGREHILYTDGRKTEEERSLGGTTRIYTQWKDGHVVVETEPEKGPSYTETYSITADRKVLTVTLRFKAHGKRPALEIRKVYDAAVPKEELPPTTPPQTTGGDRAR